MKNLYRKIVLIPIISAVFLLVANSFPLSAGEWSLSTGFQTYRGKYIYANVASTLYLWGGLNYRTSRFSFSATLPVIGQNSGGITAAGRMIMPDGGREWHQTESHMGEHGGMFMAEGSSAPMEFGVGDVYLFGEWLLFQSLAARRSLSVSAQAKIPTASTVPLYGTGQFDFGFGATLRQGWRSYQFLLSGNYLNLGDPDGLVYRNPVYVGVGAGKFFGGGKWSLMAYYEQYSEILSGISPPKQASVTAFYRATPGRSFSIGVQKGFSESSPDFGLLIGVEQSL